MLGIWRAGGISVPLCPEHPPEQLEYIISDCDASIVIGHEKYGGFLRPVTEGLGRRYLPLEDILLRVSNYNN